MTRYRLVGFTGRAGAGKDTAADFVAKAYGFRRHAFADPMKAGLNAMFGWSPLNWQDRAWKEAPNEALGGFSPRFLAQTLGTEWGRQTVHSNLWVWLAEQRWQRLNADNAATFGPLPGMAVSDVRFANEAYWIKTRGGAVIEIARPDAAPVSAHASEAGVPRELIDHVVLNDGSIEDLFEKLRRVLTAPLTLDDPVGPSAYP
jgi:hypothetical protein